MFDADTEERHRILYLVEYKFRRRGGDVFLPYEEWRVSSPITEEEDFDFSRKERAYKEKPEELTLLDQQKLLDDVQKAEEFKRACRIRAVGAPPHGSDIHSGEFLVDGNEGAFGNADERQRLQGELSASRQELQEANDKLMALRKQLQELQSRPDLAKELKEANEERATLREQVKKLQSKPANKSAETKVEKTRLRMIYGMARDKYALKPGIRNSVAANIASALQRKDIDIDVDTVRNHLNDAIKLCEQPVAKEENPRTTDV